MQWFPFVSSSSPHASCHHSAFSALSLLLPAKHEQWCLWGSSSWELGASRIASVAGLHKAAFYFCVPGSGEWCKELYVACFSLAGFSLTSAALLSLWNVLVCDLQASACFWKHQSSFMRLQALSWACSSESACNSVTLLALVERGVLGMEGK